VLRVQGDINAPNSLHNGRALPLHENVDRLTAAVDDRRVLLVERDA
jgi:hypothetical protein